LDCSRDYWWAIDRAGCGDVGVFEVLPDPEQRDRTGRGGI